MQKKAEKIPNNGKTPSGPDFPLRSFRKESLRLLRESTRELGWKYKLWIPLSILLATVFLLPPRILQFFTKNIDRLSQIDGSEFLTLLILFGGIAAICLWIGIFLGGVLAEWLRIQLSINLRSAALNSLLASKLERIDDAKRGDWMTRMTSDLSSCEDFLSDSLPEQIRNLTILLGSAILFAIHSGWIALIPLVAAALLGWLNILAQKRMAPVLGQTREIEGTIFQTLIEGFEGIRTIRSYGGEPSIRTHLASQLASLKSAGMRIIKIMSALMGINEMASQIVITLILSLVAFRVAGQDLGADDALVYPFYINLFLNSAKNLVGSAYDWNRFFIEGGRLASLLYDESGKLNEEESVKGTLGVSAIIAKGIEIRYGDTPPVVSGFDLDVKRGELVALMGPSGSGKSTILEVLAGLRSHSGGELFLSTRDGENENVPMIPKSLSAYVEQQPYLFVGSIRDNIGLGQSNLFDVEIKSVVKAVGLEKAIEERGGLDALLEDRGRNWSVGQQYRLSFCRALISRRAFLMLDEPFAALDENSIGEVIRTIELARRSGAGIVLATHILPDELAVDQVIELQRGGW